MAITAMATIHKINKARIACIFSLFPAMTFAGDWEFKPHFTLDETFSDNVELTRNNTTSSLVSQFGLMVDEKYKAKNAALDFSWHGIYAMYSHDSDINNDFHSMQTNGHIMLWPDGIKLTGSASLANQTKNGAGNSLADIVSGDTVQVLRYQAGLNYQVDNSDFLINASLNANETRSEDNIGERYGYTAQLSTQNGSQARLLFWDVAADYQEQQNNNNDKGESYRTEIKLGFITNYNITPFVRYFNEENNGNIYNNNKDLSSNSYGLGMRWLVSPRLLFDLSYNKPIDDQTDLDGNTLDEYVDAQVLWQPSARTLLRANFSQRFYGDSYGLSFTHRNRRLTNSITYNESVQAFTRDNYQLTPYGNFWCPNDGFNDVNDCYIESNSEINFDDYNLVAVNEYELVEDNEFSLNESLTWKSELALPRTTFTLNLTGNNRKSLETFQEDERRSASFTIKRKISGYSDMSLDLHYSENSYDVGTNNERLDDYKRYSVEYHREMNSRLTSTFGISYLDRESTQEQYNYEESRVYLQFKKGF